MSEIVDKGEITSEMCCEDALQVLLSILHKQREDVLRDMAHYEKRVIELEAELDDIDDRIDHTLDVMSP